jgi:hypothetical protein
MGRNNEQETALEGHHLVGAGHHFCRRHSKPATWAIDRGLVMWWAYAGGSLLAVVLFLGWSLLLSGKRDDQDMARAARKMMKED